MNLRISLLQKSQQWNWPFKFHLTVDAGFSGAEVTLLGMFFF